jgi:hypothetical protein
MLYVRENSILFYLMNLNANKMRGELLNDKMNESLDAFGNIVDSLNISLNEWLELSSDVNPHQKHQALLYLLSRNRSGRALRRSQIVKKRLQEMTDCEHRRVRLAALIAMGSVRVPDAVPKLLTILRTNNDPIERHFAAYALGYQRDLRGLDILLECAKNPAEPLCLREQCIRSLGEFRSQRVVDELSKLALAKQWELRWAAAQSLRRLDAHLALPLLRELCDDPEVPADLQKTGRRWIRKITG